MEPRYKDLKFGTKDDFDAWLKKTAQYWKTKDKTSSSSGQIKETLPTSADKGKTDDI